MLRLDLTGLERRGSAGLDATVPVDHPLWEGTGLHFLEPVEARFQASAGVAGQLTVRGRVRGVLSGNCRRCLTDVTLPVSVECTWVFVPEGDPLVEGDGDDPPDESLRTYDEASQDLDLAEAVREELMLSAPAWPVCRPDCRGLCPRCGVDLNDTVCTCAREEPDPRWAALRVRVRDE